MDMQHSDYIQYFKERAESHYLIRHNAVDVSLPRGKRVSFFRMNKDWEAQQAANSQINYPCLLLPPYHGRLAPDEGDAVISDVMTGFLEVRDYVSDPLDFAAIEAARDRCKKIALDIIAYMMQQEDDDGACGPIEDFNPASVQYDFTGPTNINEYGCLVFFEFRDLAFNALTTDLTGIFL